MEIIFDRFWKKRELEVNYLELISSEEIGIIRRVLYINFHVFLNSCIFYYKLILIITRTISYSMV